MNLLEEMEWRGMIHNFTPGVEEVLKDGMVTGYIGFDPTAPSLTIGNYVQVMLLTLLQKCGHKPIVLMGGATGRVGDPSGKDKERELKSFEELDKNLAYQAKLFRKFLNFEEGANKAEMINNYSFYENMNILDFLRKVGKTLTVSYMMTKESVKRRIETGISFTEFSYQLLQGYDFQCLFEQKNCILQMGGSDQWGNITSGTEFIRRNLSGKAYAITTPLLTKADGSKFGKSTEGNIWVDPALTTAYAFYQFWIQAADQDLPKFIRYFTLKSREEVEALEKEYETNPRGLKEILAEELTIRIHSKDAFDSVKKVSQNLFNPKAKRDGLLSLSKTELDMVAAEIQCFSIPKETLANGINIIDLLTDHTGILKSKGEARRAVKGNAISVNKEKMTSMDIIIDAAALLHGSYFMVENGKKNKYIVKV